MSCKVFRRCQKWRSSTGYQTHPGCTGPASGSQTPVSTSGSEASPTKARGSPLRLNLPSPPEATASSGVRLLEAADGALAPPFCSHGALPAGKCHDGQPAAGCTATLSNGTTALNQASPESSLEEAAEVLGTSIAAVRDHALGSSDGMQPEPLEDQAGAGAIELASSSAGHSSLQVDVAELRDHMPETKDGSLQVLELRPRASTCLTSEA